MPAPRQETAVHADKPHRRRLLGLSVAGGTARLIRRELLPVSSRAVDMHPRPIITSRGATKKTSTWQTSTRLNPVWIVNGAVKNPPLIQHQTPPRPAIVHMPAMPAVIPLHTAPREIAAPALGQAASAANQCDSDK